MRTPLERIRIGALFFGVVLVVAILGYRLSGRDWMSSLYMVVITVTTVGYGDDKLHMPSSAEQFFTVVVIVLGVTAGAYTIGGFLQMMAEGEIDRALGRRRMTREIQQLRDHVIICGFGRIGQILASEIASQDQFVVVDNDPARVTEAGERQLLVLSGDATEEEILLAAGVERAKALVTSLPNDAANVFITLTSRNLNQNLRIVSRAEYRTSEKKLLQAGANRVVLPASIGATQMARLITRPNTAELIELLSDRSQLDLELDEVRVAPGGPLVGKSVEDAETHRRHRLLVVAVKQPDGNMVFNPGGEYIFQEEDMLIVMGRTDDIDRFEFDYGLKHK